LKFLFDHNLPPSWARGLDALSLKQFEAGTVNEVVALKDKFPHNTIDAVWLKALSTEGDWTVISGDFFRKSKAEKELVRSSGLNVFVLPKVWHSQPHWVRTARLIEWWPKIVAQANSVDKACFELPWRVSGKFTQIRL
jgi:PIN like domain